MPSSPGRIEAVWSFPDSDRVVVLRLLPQQRERPVNGFVQRVRLNVLASLDPSRSFRK